MNEESDQQLLTALDSQLNVAVMCMVHADAEHLTVHYLDFLLLRVLTDLLASAEHHLIVTSSFPDADACLYYERRATKALFLNSKNVDIVYEYYYKKL